MSLNDRFTIMQKVGGGSAQSQPPRARSRSRSRSRARAPAPAPHPATTLRNRSLLAQLEQKHKLRAALKIKRVR